MIWWLASDPRFSKRQINFPLRFRTHPPHSLTVQPEVANVLGTGENIGGGLTNTLGTYPSGSNQLWGYDPYELGNSPIPTSTGDTIALTVLPEPCALGLIAILGGGLLVSGRRLCRRLA